MIKEHDIVVLTKDVPDEELLAGDVGTIVTIYKDGKGYEVEFTTPGGETRCVVTVAANMVRPVR